MGFATSALGQQRQAREQLASTPTDLLLLEFVLVYSLLREIQFEGTMEKVEPSYDQAELSTPGTIVRAVKP